MQITVSLPKSYVDRIKTEKKETEQAMSEIIRRALDMYFARGLKND